MQEITIGNIVYTKNQAIALIQNPVRNDKRYTLFPALVCAKLNKIIGNESSCVDQTIVDADGWWAAFNASPVPAKSEAWKLGEPLYLKLDAYNNGLLCAPHRN